MKKSINWQGEPRALAENEYVVQLPNGEQGLVTIGENEILLDNGHYVEGHTRVSLTNAARRGRLPEWTKQVPGLVEKIEAVFAEERAKGLNPHQSFSNGDGKLTVTDLRSGTSLSADVAELRRRYGQTGRLPRAFESPRARQLLNIAA